MRRLTLILLALTVAISTYAAKNRQIGYVQQETPGELVIVSVIESKKNATVVVREAAKGLVPVDYTISKEEFDDLWTTLTGPDAEVFTIKPNKDTNMSDIGFYSIKITSKKTDLWIRIPSDSCPQELRKTIDKIQSYINK